MNSFLNICYIIVVEMKNPYELAIKLDNSGAVRDTVINRIIKPQKTNL